MTLVTTINGGPNLVTTVQAAPVSGAALTVVGTLATALSLASTPIVITEVNIGRPGPQGPAGPGSTWGGIAGTLADQTDLAAALNAKLAIAAFTWSNLPGKPTEFTPTTHGHVISDVTGLQAALDGKLATASFTWTGLSGKPSTFPPDAHVHTIANVTGLQAALDAKQPSGSYASASHTHAISDVTGLSSALSLKLDAASFTWTGLSGKPSTFPPDAHGHDAAAISDFAAAARAQIEAMLANGTNVSFSFAGAGASRTLTINASGGGGGSGVVGSATLTIVEPTQLHEEQVSAPGMVADTPIFVGLSPGLVEDENTADMLDVLCVYAQAVTDAIIFSIAFHVPTSGPIKLIWRT